MLTGVTYPTPLNKLCVHGPVIPSKSAGCRLLLPLADPPLHVYTTPREGRIATAAETTMVELINVSDIRPYNILHQQITRSICSLLEKVDPLLK